MKIVLAPDKFKNSLSSLQFCEAVEKGIMSRVPNVAIIKLPLADGGDGTIELIKYYLNAEEIKVQVKNPFFRKITATYLFSDESKTAYIEMAEASGYKLLRPYELDCKNTTTFGTGELILDAIKQGAYKIILGIGGSATNDCGIGMAVALGYRFLDDNNEIIKPIGANLSKIKHIDLSLVYPGLNTVEFQIACDVTNPLYGPKGAAYTYAVQKGASSEDIEMLDKGLRDFSKLIESEFGIDPQKIKGAGAAGGMGIASKIFLNGNLEPGIELIKKLADFESNVKNADWIITGEGQLDFQTFSGKTIQGVLSSAKKNEIKVAAFCGAVKLSEKEIHEMGIIYSDAVMNYAENFEDAMENAYEYVKEMAKRFAENHFI